MADYSIGSVVDSAVYAAQLGYYWLRPVKMINDIYVVMTLNSSTSKLYVYSLKLQAGMLPPLDQVIDTEALSYGSYGSASFNIIKLDDTTFCTITSDDFFSDRSLYNVFTIDAAGNMLWQTAMNGNAVPAAGGSFNWLGGVLLGSVSEQMENGEYATAFRYITTACVHAGSSQYHAHVEVITYCPTETKMRIKDSTIIPTSTGNASPYILVKRLSDTMALMLYERHTAPSTYFTAATTYSVDAYGALTQEATTDMHAFVYITTDLQELSNVTNGWWTCSAGNIVFTFTANPTTGAIALLDWQGPIPNPYAGLQITGLATCIDLGSDYYAFAGEHVVVFQIDNAGAINTTPDDSAIDLIPTSSYWYELLDDFGGTGVKSLLALSTGGTFTYSLIYFGTPDPVVAQEHSDFVTGIIHRWVPGSHTMELLLGGVEDDYQIPAISAAAAGEEAIKMIEAVVGGEEFKFPTPTIPPIKVPNRIYPLVNSMAPPAVSQIGPVDIGDEIKPPYTPVPRGTAVTRMLGTSPSPQWIKEKEEEVERTTTKVYNAQTEAVRRIQRMIDKFGWRV